MYSTSNLYTIDDHSTPKQTRTSEIQEENEQIHHTTNPTSANLVAPIRACRIPRIMFRTSPTPNPPSSTLRPANLSTLRLPPSSVSRNTIMMPTYNASAFVRYTALYHRLILFSAYCRTFKVDCWTAIGIGGLWVYGCDTEAYLEECVGFHESWLLEYGIVENCVL
jgi:hypothetical protein